MLQPASRDHDYWSVDSAPARLTRPLSVWAAPTLLVLFTMVATVLLALISTEPLRSWFPNGDVVFSPYLGVHSIPLRIFIVSFTVAFSAVVGARAPGRLKFFLEVTLYYLVVCAAFDLINIVAFRLTGFVYSIHVVEILSGLFGFFIFSTRLLDQGTMPPRAPSAPFRLALKPLSFLSILAAVALAMAISLWVDGLALPLVDDLRSVALLGGTGPGVFLFLPVLFFILYVLGTLKSVLGRKRRFSPAVTVIIPAHNEAHILPRTLAALDAAAARYEGEVHVLVLDNCSTDTTPQAATEAFAALGHILGRVVSVPVPGKSNALNAGIAATDTPFVIRIDADTQIHPDAIRYALRHFASPDMGVVGGLPIAPGTGKFDRARDLETLLKHGYYQVAYGAVDAIVGVPGMFAVYRTQAVREAGGFVGGMNGEDTDMSLRIGEMGYRIVGDPTITYVSEVPRSWTHLREQRMRWFRSVYHVSARNRAYLDGWTGSVRGKIILPFMLLNSGRRAMTVPLVIFGVLYYFVGFNPMTPLTLPAVVAVVLGAPALMAAFAALANGRVKALVGLPEYILFRLVRSYLTLESVLSIAFDKMQSNR
ncbi:glycosyltransferase [Pelagibacterium lacus]|uniref:Glycosyltransferase family 2 protein n=1 Tax=Pelagibacterium lacus TaxID=2282655 RepID=A0A369W5U0_9HYPH|nr:glycosyltransferase [Pelagibacterium lacus]RDE10034.1 glycosyltransferase family 2 protein [Pelagibacterium lacus]